MIDLHLINTALAGLGIGAGAALLIAAAVIAIAVVARRAAAGRLGRLNPLAAGPTASMPVSHESLDHKEPALR